MSWVFPFTDNRITGHYGTMSDFRKSRGMQAHSGTDWAMKTGTLIPAIAAGQVKLIQWSNILGWTVVQSAKDNKGATWFLAYCHLTCYEHGDKCKGDHATPLKSTKVGDTVIAGQEYLRVGNTGSATTGSHLHATASKTVKGVFGATSVKVDLYKLIQANQAPAIKPEVKRQNAQPIAQKPEVEVLQKTVYACPHCKKELK